MGREALAEVAQANRPQSDSERDSLPEMVDAAASNAGFWPLKPNLFLLIHEAQQGCRDATYEPSRFQSLCHIRVRTVQLPPTSL